MYRLLSNTFEEQNKIIYIWIVGWGSRSLKNNLRIEIFFISTYSSNPGLCYMSTVYGWPTLLGGAFRRGWFSISLQYMAKKYIFLGVDRVGHLPAWTSVHWWKHFLPSQDLLHPRHQAESSTRQWTNQLQEGCQSLFSSCSTVWFTMASDILQVKYINPPIYVTHHVLSSMCDLPH